MFNTNFSAGDLIRKVLRAPDLKKAYTFIENLDGLGCHVEKSLDGRTATVVVDGYSDMSFPPEMNPPWPVHNPDGPPGDAEYPNHNYGKDYMVWQLQTIDGQQRQVWDWVRFHEED
jgi:hypothetical protein